MWQFFPRTTSLWYVGGEHVIWSKLIQDHACYYTAHENIEGIEFWKFLPALGVEPSSTLVAPPTHKCSIRHYVVLTQVGTAEAMAVQFSEVSYCWLASVRYRVWYGNIQCIRTHVNRLPCGCDYAFNNWHFWLMFYKTTSCIMMEGNCEKPRWKPTTIGHPQVAAGLSMCIHCLKGGQQKIGLHWPRWWNALVSLCGTVVLTSRSWRNLYHHPVSDFESTTH